MSSDTERELVEREKRRIARQRAKEARRLAKEAQRRARRERQADLSSAESAFEAAVEEGVTALLNALAGQLARVSQAGEDGRAPSEFDRYVAKKKGGDRIPAADAPVDASAPRARVAIDQAAAEVVEEELEEERRQRSG
jgi:hypothetical protein